MEQSFNLERNLDSLLADMRVLKQLKSEVERTGNRKVKIWLQKVNAIESELDGIHNQLTQLQTPGFHPNKYNIRLSLNKKVIENIKAVSSLKSLEIEEILGERDDNEIETRISELERGKKPQRYTYDELANIISNVILGKGGFGYVYKGEIGKVEVAVKVLIKNADKVIQKQFMNEISPMFIASHKNLIWLHEYCFEPETKALVYEYMVNKSLDKVLYNKEANIQWDTLYQIAIGTAKALSNLHEDYSETIIHYDIKAANVLLDANYSPKVTDFGLCKIYEKDVSHVMQSSIGGTANYAAPEVRLGAKSITLKCDIYSFGLMLFEILRRKRVTKDYPPKVWERLMKGRLDKMILDCGVEKKDVERARKLSIVGLWCTQFLPKYRPKMSDVVKVLEGVMHISPLPPNPDPYATVSEAPEIPIQLVSSTKSDNYDERSYDVDDVEEEDSWTEKKYASTSTLNIPVMPARNTGIAVKQIQNEVKEHVKKTSTYASTRPTLQNKQSELKRAQERKTPTFPNVQGQTNRKPSTREFGVPPTSAEAIPSSQDLKFSGNEEADDDFDPTPYIGGYNLASTYGRPLPPCEETCYPISFTPSFGVDYEGFHNAPNSEASAYGNEALHPEYSSYARPKTGYDGEHSSYGLQSWLSESEYALGWGSGYGRKPVYERTSYVQTEEEEGYGSGYVDDNYGEEEKIKPSYKRISYRQSEEEDLKPSHQRTGYGRKEEESHGTRYGRREEEGERKPSYERTGYGQSQEEEEGKPIYGQSQEYGSGYGRKQEEEERKPIYGQSQEYGSGYVRKQEEEERKPIYGQSQEYGSGYGRKQEEGERNPIYGQSQEYGSGYGQKQEEEEGKPIYGQSQEYGSGYGRKQEEEGKPIYGQSQEYGSGYGRKQEEEEGKPIYGQSQEYGSGYGRKQEEEERKTIYGRGDNEDEPSEHKK